MPSRKSSIGVRGFILVVVLGFCGCSNKGDLSGIVTYQGKKLQFGTVQVRSSDGVVHSAQIDLDGSYRLADVTSGRAVIAVICLDPEQTQHNQSLVNDRRVRLSATAGRGHSKSFFLIPEKYADLDHPELETTVTGGDCVFDIELH